MLNFSSFRKVNRAEVLHSHAIAQTTLGGQVGAGDTTSFQQRLEREKQRTIIGGYETASLNHAPKKEFMMNRPKPTAAPAPQVQKTTDVVRGRQAYNANRGSLGVPTRAFTEPPKRSYNPYG